MRKDKAPQQLSKFLAYMLGRRPDEFGLMPDQQGFLKLKTVLQALSEEPGWRHVREAHLNEVLMVLPQPTIERRGKHLRAIDRQQLPALQPAHDLPKLLYTCVRRRAYAHVSDKGLHPAAGGSVTLAADPEMAQRMGRRIDPQPIMLTVNVAQAESCGVVFDAFGVWLYAAKYIPTGCFTGPPLPKERVPERKTAPPAPTPPSPMPGSYVVQLDQDKKHPAVSHRRRRGKEVGWKEHRKQLRKQKKKFDKHF